MSVMRRFLAARMVCQHRELLPLKFAALYYVDVLLAITRFIRDFPSCPSLKSNLELFSEARLCVQSQDSFRKAHLLLAYRKT